MCAGSGWNHREHRGAGESCLDYEQRLLQLQQGFAELGGGAMAAAGIIFARLEKDAVQIKQFAVVGLLEHAARQIGKAHAVQAEGGFVNQFTKAENITGGS